MWWWWDTKSITPDLSQVEKQVRKSPVWCTRWSLGLGEDCLERCASVQAGRQGQIREEDYKLRKRDPATESETWAQATEGWERRSIAGKEPWRTLTSVTVSCCWKTQIIPTGLVSSPVDMPFPWGTATTDNLVTNVRTISKANGWFRLGY